MLKNFIRSLQTFFPFLHDFRFASQSLYRRLLNKPHDEDFNAIALFNPPENSTFLDIGSNRGEAIQSMLLNKRDDINLIGFEPNPLIFPKLKKAHGHNAKLILNNFGLGDKELSLELFIPFYRKWMFDGLASFQYEQAANWLRGRLWNYQESQLSIKKVICSIKTLDNLHLDPFFIKIDVQGFELQVIKGGLQTIRKNHPIILIESITTPIIDLLNSEGYNFFYYEEGVLKEGKGKLNTFCITKDKFPTPKN